MSILIEQNIMTEERNVVEQTAQNNIRKNVFIIATSIDSPKMYRFSCDRMVLTNGLRLLNKPSDDGDDGGELPVQISVNDWLGQIVQILHALGHINGNDELGLQINDSRCKDIIK